MPQNTSHIGAATAGGVVSRLAGPALVVGPLLFLVGLLVSPAGDTTDPGSSITAFVDAPTQTQVSSLLLHYGLILMALGLLRAPSLVPARRGTWPTVVGSLVTAVGMVNVSGGLRDDWWRLAAGRQLPLDQAIDVVHEADTSSLLVLWDVTEVFAFLGVLLVLTGLARARALSWWWLAAAVAAFAATLVVPGDLQVWPSLVFGAFIATLVPVGLRLLRPRPSTSATRSVASTSITATRS